jgi:hypothetical protein
LRKKAKGNPVVIPTTALHDSKVYIVDDEKRLEIRQVKTIFTQGAATAIAKGLEEGETLVVSDLVPATKGMLLDTVEDEKAMKRLKMEATGNKGRKR